MREYFLFFLSFFFLFFLFLSKTHFCCIIYPNYRREFLKFLNLVDFLSRRIIKKKKKQDFDEDSGIQERRKNLCERNIDEAWKKRRVQVLFLNPKSVKPGKNCCAQNRTWPRPPLKSLKS